MYTVSTVPTVIHIMLCYIGLFHYLVSGCSPASECLKTPGLTVFTSTLLTQMAWRKFELDGIHEMAADVDAIFVAVTDVGPRGASFPTTTVHAASCELRPLSAHTVLTLRRWMADMSRPVTHHKVTIEPLSVDDMQYGGPFL